MEEYNLQEDLKIYSEEVQDVLSAPPKKTITWGNTILFGFIVIILFISWLIKYPDIIVGEAVITTQIPPQKEYAKVTAKLDSLLVKNDDIVTDHTLIAILENTANYNDVLFLKNVVDTISLYTKKFKFPINKMPMLILGDIASQYDIFENNYRKYIIDKELNPFQYEINSNKITVSELQSRLQILKSQLRISNDEMKLENKGLIRNKGLFEKGVISRVEYEQTQLKYLQVKRNFKSISSSISEIKKQINTLKNKTIGDKISNTQNELKLLKDAIQSFIQLKKSIADWELKYTFRSKMYGNVSFLKYWNKNQTVHSGDLVCTVIPRNHQGFVVKAKVPTINSGKLKQGQTVHIKLLNYPEKEFGILIGKVVSISNIPNEEKMYIVDINLDQEELITTYGKRLIFKQEMLATVNIVAEDLRLIERFFYNFNDFFKR